MRFLIAGLGLCVLNTNHLVCMDRLARLAHKTGLFSSPQNIGRRLGLLAGGASGATPQQRTFADQKDEYEGLAPEEIRVLMRAEATTKKVPSKQTEILSYHPQSAIAGDPTAVHEYVEHLLAQPYPSVRNKDWREALQVLNRELNEALTKNDHEDQEECVRAIGEVLDEHFTANVRR